MSRRAIGGAALLFLGCVGSATPALAQTSDVSAAIQELRAENARLAAKIDALERELARQRQGNPGTPEPATAPLALAAPPPKRPETFDAPDRVVEVTPPPAPPERPVQGGGVGFQVSASSSGGQVALTLGQSLRKTGVKGDEVDASGTTWSITASAPVAKSGDTMLGTLDSFTDSATLKIRVGRLFTTMPNLLAPGSDYQRLMQDVVDACIAKAKDEAGITTCWETDIDQGTVQKWLPNRVDEYIQLTTGHRTAWGYGVEGSIGYRKYEFIDPVTGAKDSSEKVPWGIKGYGTVLPSPDAALVASLAYQRGYKEQSVAIRCPAVSTGSTFVCQTGPDGRPVGTEKLLLALEVRKLFDLTRTRSQNGVIDRFAIAPQVTYDLNNDDAGVDVPIYLAADDKGNLIGGIRLGYKTGKEGFNAGVFVGGAFDLFKR